MPCQNMIGIGKQNVKSIACIKDKKVVKYFFWIPDASKWIYNQDICDNTQRTIESYINLAIKINKII